MPSPIRAALLFLPLALLCCNRTETANGEVTTQQRDVQAFTRINVNDGLRVVLTNGQRSLAVTAAQNLLENVDVTVENDVLMVRVKPGVTIQPTRSVTVQVSTEVLLGAEVTGDSSLTADATRADEFVLNVSRNSSATVSRIDASRLTLESTTSSQVTVSGTATDLSVKANGPSTVNAQGLSATNVTVDASDDAQLLLNASGSATGTASGNASVNVAGNPATQSIESSGNAAVSYDPPQ